MALTRGTLCCPPCPSSRLGHNSSFPLPTRPMAVVLAQPAPGEQSLMELEVRSRAKACTRLATRGWSRASPSSPNSRIPHVSTAPLLPHAPAPTRPQREARHARRETQSRSRWSGGAVGAAYQDRGAGTQAARRPHGLPRAVALPARGLRRRPAPLRRHLGLPGNHAPPFLSNHPLSCHRCSPSATGELLDAQGVDLGFGLTFPRASGFHS